MQAGISACRICRDEPLRKSLPHEPRPVAILSATAKICIAGQAPGARVHASGIPFDDRSGDRLREWMGLKSEDFYDEARLAIVPMGFCFPGYDANGSDLPPRRECRLRWHDDIFKAMPQLELVIAIGTYAQAYHLGNARTKTMTETVQNWRRHFQTNQGRPVLPIPHPSWRNTHWLNKNPWFEADVLPVLKSEVSRLMGE